jgi:phosphonate transport system ATP-binding protein
MIVHRRRFIAASGFDPKTFWKYSEGATHAANEVAVSAGQVETRARTPTRLALRARVRPSVRGLSKSFHGRAAIEDIGFTASRHEFMAVPGPSGAGDRVALMDVAMRRADTLSGAQQQRVAIARALAQCPRLIVADEPVASLDPSASAGVLDLLHGIARSEGVAVVCSLHQVHLARAFADRLVGLSKGRVVFDLPAARFDENAFERLYRSHVTDSMTC